MSHKRKTGSRLTPQQEDKLACLAELLSPHVEVAIANLMELANDPTVRCATRERANSRVITMYFNALTVGAALDAEQDTDSQPNVTVVVNQSTLDDASARAQALRLQRLQRDKQSS